MELGYLIDPLIIHTDPAIAPFLTEDGHAIDTTKELPPGLREWRKFGSPPGAPGQVRSDLEHSFPFHLC